MTTVLTATVYCISVLPYFAYLVGENFRAADDKTSSFFHVSFHRTAESFLYLNTISNFYIYILSVHSFRDFVCSRIQLAYQTFTNIRTAAHNGKGVTF